MQDQSKPKARHAEPLVLGALTKSASSHSRGPRQSGKTTLAHKIAADREMSFITLDDEQFCQFVNDDPSRFIRGPDHAVRSHPGA
jgi:predicted AAA+ superfamily ATPase